MKPDGSPRVLLLFSLLIGFVVWSSGPAPISPPYSGKIPTWSGTEELPFYCLVNTAGIQPSEIERVTGPLPSMLGEKLLLITPKETKLVTGDGEAEEPLSSSLFRGNPKIRLGGHSNGASFSALLYQSDKDRLLFSGPLRGSLDNRLMRKPSAGVDLQALSILPADTERAFLVDTGSISLSDELRTRLIDEWKRWEFEPYVSLSKAFGPAFCYAEREGERIVVAQVVDSDSVQRAIEQRFSSSVTKTVSLFSHGVVAQGFTRRSKPAWTLRGDYLLAVIGGGLEGLDKVLQARYSSDGQEQVARPVRKELSRLSSTKAGWQVCLFEQRPDSPIHWALLARWTPEKEDNIEGYVVVWLPSELYDGNKR